MHFLHKNIFGVYASKDLTFHFFFLLLFKRSVMSNSLWPHELQHAKHPCPSPSPGACSNSSLLSQWCPSTISSSVVPFSCLQSFPASWSFSVNFLSLSYRKLYLLNEISSVTQSCLTLCDPIDWSTPVFPVHHQLLEPAQTHVHQVSDDIQSSQTLASPSPPAFNLSQHQCLFRWVSSLLVSNETRVISMVVIKPEKSKLEKTQVHCLSFFLLLFLWDGIIYPSSYLSSKVLSHINHSC